ncbi:guanosine-3',5'-bis(diphosphate) 3'-pyrophosphohydrolase [Methylococcales bacterium]|nr:guanosine-3',5'-bis(diphosphate) 3'-pyrophosphohydrolase [Methylococcales bacterium]
MYSYRLEQAIRAAAVLHKDQKRRGKLPLPYITHLAAVAWLVSDYTDHEDTVIAAWLHDTLEDTDYTAEELEEDFGRDVRRIVETLSEPKERDGKKLPWKERKLAYLEQLKAGPDEALLVAAADKIHNMRSIVEEYYDNHEGFIKDFSGSLDERAMRYQDLSNLLNRRLQSDIIAEFNHVYTEYKNFLVHVKKSEESIR